MKKTIINHLAYRWWVYVLLLLAVSIFWNFVFEKMAEPMPDEKLALSVFAEELDVQSLEKDLTAALTDEGLKRITAERAVAESDYQFQTALWSRTQESDLVIVEKSRLFDTLGQSYFLPLEENEVTALLGSVEFYREDGIAYGIYLPQDGVLSKYTSNEAQLCLFLCPASSNVGDLFGGVRENNAALIAAEWLLGGGN